MKNSFLSEQLSQLSSSTSWITRITDVEVQRRDTAVVGITRPDCGTGVQYGGLIRVYDLDNNLIVEQKVAQTSPPTTTVNYRLQDSKLNFYQDTYIIGYGPDNVDKGVNSMCTRVVVSPDAIYDFQGSSCNLMTATDRRITGRYSVPRSFDNIGTMRIYVVEGGELLDSKQAIGGNDGIVKLSSSAPPTDIVNINYADGTFEVGKTYTLCLNVYSWTRQIAGQSFVFS